MGDSLIIIFSELRELTRKPAHVINHAIDRYGPKPAGRIGLIRYWNRSDLPAILASLEKTAAHPSSVDRRKAAAS